jgi:hypothetical protein
MHDGVIVVKFVAEARDIHLTEAAVSLFMSVRPSVLIEQVGSHWTDFYEIWYLSIFRKSVKNLPFSLKSDKNNGYFT